MIYYNMNCFLNMIIISANKNFLWCQGVQIWWIRKCQNFSFAKFFPIVLPFFQIGGWVNIDGRIYILHTICVQYSLNMWNVTKGENRLWLKLTLFDLIGKRPRYCLFLLKRHDIQNSMPSYFFICIYSTSDIVKPKYHIGDSN